MYTDTSGVKEATALLVTADGVLAWCRLWIQALDDPPVDQGNLSPTNILGETWAGKPVIPHRHKPLYGTLAFWDRSQATTPELGLLLRGSTTKNP